MLKEARLKKNLSQEELAAKVGVSRQTISMIETGVNKPSVKLAKKLGEELEIDWSLFFSDNAILNGEEDE